MSSCSLCRPPFIMTFKKYLSAKKEDKLTATPPEKRKKISSKRNRQPPTTLIFSYARIAKVRSHAVKVYDTQFDKPNDWRRSRLEKDK